MTFDFPGLTRGTEDGYPEGALGVTRRLLWRVAIDNIDKRKAEKFYQKALVYVKATKPSELKPVKKLSIKTFDSFHSINFCRNTAGSLLTNTCSNSRSVLPKEQKRFGSHKLNFH